MTRPDSPALEAAPRVPSHASTGTTPADAATSAASHTPADSHTATPAAPTTPRAPLLDVRDLRKSFGGNRAVDGVSFRLQAGEVLALIGPNGAGKSTTFNLLNGQLAPDGGEVLLDGLPLTGATPDALARRGVGRTFQTAQTFASFSVVENVQIALLAHDGLALRGWCAARAHRRADALSLLAQVDLQAQADAPCSTLAYGDVKRLELALALAGAPRLLLMDEPTAGMALAERLTLMALVTRLVRERNMAVLLTEHSMDVVFGHADRVLVMARGQLLAEGTPQQVRDDPRVQAVYLGRSATDAASRRAASAPGDASSRTVGDGGLA